MATEDNHLLPLLSLEDNKKLDRLQKNLKKAKQTLIVVVSIAAFAGVIALIYAWYTFHWTGWLLFLLILLGIGLLILFIRAGYTAQWTGFGDKKLWDWLGLLAKVAVPLILGFATIGFGMMQQHLADVQHLQDQQRIQDQQQEATLKSYLNDMTTLLLDKKLGSQATADQDTRTETAIIAQAETLITFHHLTDPRRKATVVQFLYESHLIGYYEPTRGSATNPPLLHPIINLDGADLTYTDLSCTSLSGNQKVCANLRGANLSGASLERADLSGAHLRGADLFGAHLSGTDLSSADLHGANLSCTSLSDSQKACADLRGADLSGADLSGALLFGADLSGADLSGAQNLAQQQLDQVYSCKNASLPSGLTCHKQPQIP